uniref:Uncharacterized protein n=3 Tax=Avena sativa TaxID=4498 RepID=A0ACD5XCU1_AVESA
MPQSVAAVDAVIKPLPRALSVTAAVAAAAATSLLLISAVVSRARDDYYASPPAPSTSASTTAALPPAPEPSPSLPEPEHPHPPPPPVPPCPPNASHHVPCHDPPSAERHCPPRPPHPPPHPPEDPPPHPPPPPPHCRVPPPPGYLPPPPWPERRERARYANADLPPLTATKLAASQDPVGERGEWLVFPKGVGNYVEHLERVVPLRGGAVRTALDIGCGFASFGDYLLSYGVLTMSIAERNTHDAQVQFALERGLPAMIGALGARRLPYPSRSFDMVHCADCHVSWTAHDGLYMLEIDRLLRPGGYWVMSGPPISWKSHCSGLNQTIKNLGDERLAMEHIASKLCWENVSDKGAISVWRKPTNHLSCAQESKLWRSLPLCTEDNPDSAWYVNISMCISHLPRVDHVGDTAAGVVEKWPQRLVAVPPRVANGEIKGMSIEAYKYDYSIWKRRVEIYGTYLKDLSHRSYRNVMDMNAGFGGFAAAMSKYPVWVMNVVPANMTDNTLGIIYERGLVGTYMDWCEAFSTYPRTYDLIHANGVFSLYIDKCGTLDILVEMDRILRPGGAVIVLDAANVVLKVKEAADRLQWRSRVVDMEDGASDPHKLLIVENSLPLPGR